MREYQCSSPNVQVIGGMLQSFWLAFPEYVSERGKKILEKHGLKDVVLDGWYSLQLTLDALKEVEEALGREMLRRIGDQAAARAPLPPEINSLKACLLMLNPTLQRIHRGGDVGGYVVTENLTAGNVRFTVVASTPYPCSLTEGYLGGYAQRFKLPQFKEVIVRHDESAPCRRHGADSCTYFVTCW
jgi:hypothetical protein